jgi:hypothetical protein
MTERESDIQQGISGALPLLLKAREEGLHRDRPGKQAAQRRGAPQTERTFQVVQSGGGVTSSLSRAALAMQLAKIGQIHSVVVGIDMEAVADGIGHQPMGWEHLADAPHAVSQPMQSVPPSLVPQQFDETWQSPRTVETSDDDLFGV